MSNENNNVSIRLLDKDFLISCTPENQPDLIASARELDRRMKQIKAGGRVFGLERIAVMAALNLSHDLLKLQQQPASSNTDLEPLIEKIEQALSQSQNKP